MKDNITNIIMANRNKRAQEEIVGFVIIILLVSVVALVFFGISLRKTAPVESSVRVENFLGAALGVTTDCSIKRIPQYLELGELIKECYKNSKCFDGRKACEALDPIVKSIMDSSFPISNESPTTYYNFRAYYLGNITNRDNLNNGGNDVQNIYLLEKGNCTGTQSGNTQSISALPGVIRIEAGICVR